jgi:hypothetical protein
MTDYDFNTTFAARMKDQAPFTFKDFCEMYDWLKDTYKVRAADVLTVRLATQVDQSLLETRAAIQRFDNASAKLGTKLNFLTWVLVGLTLVVAVFTVLLFFKP